MTTEHLDVLVVGAGLSGICAGHYLQTECPWAEYAIFEGREASGGTWDLFRYPGIRSDSDMHTLGYSFRPWHGAKSIADGGDILAYLRETAAAEGIEDKIRYGHRVLSADFSTEEARWHVTAQRSDTGETFELTASFVFSCAGYYRYDRGYLPKWDGYEDFTGTIVHPQFWPEDLDYTGKRVVVIGSGATAVTLIPSLAATAGHVTMLQRSPTYIAPVPLTSPWPKLYRRFLPGPVADEATRWTHATMGILQYEFCQRAPGLAKKYFRSEVAKRLPEGYDVDKHFSPKYNPWDQRVCAVPHGDLFTAIRNGTADVVTDTIERFTPNGILLRSGEELEADIIVTATGLEMLFMGGIAASIDGEAVNPADCFVYKGMMLEGVPNAAMAIGYTNASWTLKAELTCAYVCRLLNEMRRSGMRQVTAHNVGANPTDEAPLLNLSSGYIQRAADRFPKQGDRFPWRVYQNYFADFRAMRLGKLRDGVMQFTNPAPKSDAPSGRANAERGAKRPVAAAR